MPRSGPHEYARGAFPRESRLRTKEHSGDLLVRTCGSLSGRGYPWAWWGGRGSDGVSAICQLPRLSGDSPPAAITSPAASCRVCWWRGPRLPIFSPGRYHVTPSCLPSSSPAASPISLSSRLPYPSGRDNDFLIRPTLGSRFPRPANDPTHLAAAMIA